MNSEEHIHKKSLMNALKRNPWILTTFIFGVLAIVLLLVLILPTLAISGKNVGKNFVNFINEKGGTQIEFISSKAYGSSLYEVIVSSNGQEMPAYITKDGKYFIQIVAPISESEEKTSSSTSTEIVKSDKPQIELFVMTYCPYGTQAEKGFIPAVENFGNTINAKIRFVHYFMHGDKEEKETYNQVCIREEQADKYWNYLKCFLNNSDSTTCIKQTNIDQKKLTACLANNYSKAKEYYQVDSTLSEEYGVQGSPTLVINGKIAEGGRSASSFLDAFCQAFNNIPTECSASLSSETPSAGFGYGSSGSDTTASCN